MITFCARPKRAHQVTENGLNPRVKSGHSFTCCYLWAHLLFYIMSVFVIIAVAIIALVVMLRFKVPLGPAILGSGLILWVFTNPAPHLIWDAAVQMVTQSRTWDLLAALYFVVCLEIELRKAGASPVWWSTSNSSPRTKDFACSDARVSGALPSIGGARFSAPIVEKSRRAKRSAKPPGSH